MALSTEAKAEIVQQHQQATNDTGSVEVQVALLTADIAKLTKHLQVNPKDVHSRRGLVAMVNRRRKLLNYLKKKSDQRYQQLIASLGIRK